MTDPSPIRTITNDYTYYSQLDSKRKEIRLLHILPADSDDDPLIVSLVRTTLADCPEYRALSYCWGSLEDTKTVRVLFRENKTVDSSFGLWDIHKLNEEAESLANETSPIDINVSKTAQASFEVTSNLHSALKSFRKSWGHVDFLWADMLCINQGDVEERSNQVGIMKSIYTSANPVSVWLGDDEETAAALFADDNYSLVLFKSALEDAGWKESGKKLGQFLTQDFPQRVNRGETSRHFPAESVRSSAFLKFLSGNGSRIEPISDQEGLCKAGQKRKRDDEIHEQFSECVKSFLDWIHSPYLEHLARAPFALYLPFYRYWERITDPRSDVWQWIEFEIATILQVITPNRLFQPPQDLIQRFSVISSNPWFRRVWVLQEVANNTEVCIHVGTSRVDWIVFQSLLIIILDLVTESAQWGKLLPYGDLPPPIWRDVAINTRSQELSISRIITNMRDFSATDPRDMVFAMYTLATDLSGATFTPNYTWSITETYSRFTRWIIDTTSSLDVLLASNVGFSTRNEIFPSWVPDYDQKSDTNKFLPWVYDESRASEGRQPLVIPTTTTNSLCLGGFRIATIDAIIDAKFVDELIYPNLESRKGRQYPKLADIDISILWTCLSYAYSIKFSKQLPVTQCLEFHKTTPFTVHDFSRVLLNGHTRHADRFADMWAESDLGLPILNSSLEFQQQLRRSIIRRGPLPDAATKILRMHSLEGRVFFFSHSGELGICPAGARNGDEVVVLHGGKLPFVLRRRRVPRGMPQTDKLRLRQKYEIIGPCYLDSAIKAEKFDSVHWHDPLYHEPLDADPCIDPSGEVYYRGVYRTDFFHIE